MGHSNPEELAAAYLDAAERINPRLNAFVDLRPDMVSDQARAASRRRSEGVMGRLDGIPIAVKDNIDMAGWPTRAGLPGREQAVARSDAQVVS
ncbi:MAG: amidase family protein, partial [Rhodanobacteraceae bacterium]